jgi:hypothetical protein
MVPYPVAGVGVTRLQVETLPILVPGEDVDPLYVPTNMYKRLRTECKQANTCLIERELLVSVVRGARPDLEQRSIVGVTVSNVQAFVAKHRNGTTSE